MSVTIPVNMASLIPSHPLVDVAPVAAKQAAVRAAPAPVGLRQIGQADVAARCAAAADQDRRAIEAQPVGPRSGAVRGGSEWVRTCSARYAPYHTKKKTKNV